MQLKHYKEFSRNWGIFFLRIVVLSHKRYVAKSIGTSKYYILLTSLQELLSLSAIPLGNEYEVTHMYDPLFCNHNTSQRTMNQITMCNITEGAINFGEEYIGMPCKKATGKLQKL